MSVKNVNIHKMLQIRIIILNIIQICGINTEITSMTYRFVHEQSRPVPAKNTKMTDDR